jgi:hypothetical protein
VNVTFWEYIMKKWEWRWWLSDYEWRNCRNWESGPMIESRVFLLISRGLTLPCWGSEVAEGQDKPKPNPSKLPAPIAPDIRYQPHPKRSDDSFHRLMLSLPWNWKHNRNYKPPPLSGENHFLISCGWSDTQFLFVIIFLWIGKRIGFLNMITKSPFGAFKNPDFGGTGFVARRFDSRPVHITCLMLVHEKSNET